MSFTCQSCFATDAKLQCVQCKHARYCSPECQKLSAVHIGCRHSASIPHVAYQTVILEHGTLTQGLNVGTLDAETIRNALKYLRGNKQTLITLFESISDEQIKRPHVFLGSLNDCAIAFERFNTYNTVDFPLTKRANKDKSSFEVSGLATYRKLFTELASRFRFFMQEFWPVLRPGSNQSERVLLLQIRAILEEFLQGESLLRSTERISIQGIQILNKLIMFVGNSVLQPVITRVTGVMEWIGYLLSAITLTIGRHGSKEARDKVAQLLLYTYEVKDYVRPARYMDPEFDSHRAKVQAWLTNTIALVRSHPPDNETLAHLSTLPALTRNPCMLGGNMASYIELLDEPDMFLYAETLIGQFLAGPSFLLLCNIYSRMAKITTADSEINSSMTGVKRDCLIILTKARSISHPRTAELQKLLQEFDSSLVTAAASMNEQIKAHPVGSRWELLQSMTRVLTEGSDPESKEPPLSEDVFAFVGTYVQLLELMVDVENDLYDDRGEDSDTEDDDEEETMNTLIGAKKAKGKGKSPSPSPDPSPSPTPDPRRGRVPNPNPFPGRDERDRSPKRQLDPFTAKLLEDNQRLNEARILDLQYYQNREDANKEKVDQLVGSFVRIGHSAQNALNSVQEFRAQTETTQATKRTWRDTAVKMAGVAVVSYGAAMIIESVTGYNIPMVPTPSEAWASTMGMAKFLWGRVQGQETQRLASKITEIKEFSVKQEGLLANVISEVEVAAKQVLFNDNVERGMCLLADKTLLNPGTVDVNQTLVELVRQLFYDAAIDRKPVAAAFEEISKLVPVTDAARAITPVSFVNLPIGAVKMIGDQKQVEQIVKLIWRHEDGGAMRAAVTSRINAQLLWLSEQPFIPPLSKWSQDLIDHVGATIPANVMKLSQPLIQGFLDDTDASAFMRPLITVGEHLGAANGAVVKNLTTILENMSQQRTLSDDFQASVEAEVRNSYASSEGWSLPSSPEWFNSVSSEPTAVQSMFSENPGIFAILTMSTFLCVWYGVSGGMANPRRNMFYTLSFTTLVGTMALSIGFVLPDYSAPLKILMWMISFFPGAEMMQSVLGVGGAGLLTPGQSVTTLGLLGLSFPLYDIGTLVCGRLAKLMHRDMGIDGLLKQTPAERQDTSAKIQTQEDQYRRNLGSFVGHEGNVYRGYTSTEIVPGGMISEFNQYPTVYRSPFSQYGTPIQTLSMQEGMRRAQENARMSRAGYVVEQPKWYEGMI